MSDLTGIEKRKLERAFRMSSGYVLNFSNRTFKEFFIDEFGIDIYADKYQQGSGSKASLMRSFWQIEDNNTVGRVLKNLFDNWEEFNASDSPDMPPADCLAIPQRLLALSPVPDIEAIKPNSDEVGFKELARYVRECIERNEPEAGLDRLHTFTTKYIRNICEERGLDANRNKPLHSLFGELFKSLKAEGLVESAMTERILKSSISIMEAFNDVRNKQSYAHDNTILSYSESLLIYNNISSPEISPE